jgi:hypothetical protein
MNRSLFYLARALSLCIVVFFAFFLSESTLPPFRQNYPLILALIVLGISICAWYIPMMGGVLFLLFGIRYFLMISNPDNWTPSLWLLAAFMVTGVLFMWEGYKTQRGNRPLDRKLWFP